ncbi:MAG TPA: N-acetylmuramoyl-L-alanine amidase [Acidimicrobiales bacterium]|nr:N-acetylmuramoyl-L-alanine amidase [Acidimicrobiales bacterium]
MSNTTAVVLLRRPLARVLVFLTTITALQLVGVPTAWSTPAIRVASIRVGEGGVHRAPFALSHVGLRWQGSEAAVVQVRWQQPSGQWTEWRGVGVNHDLEDETTGTVYASLVRVDGARSVDTRVVRGEARSLTVAAIDTVHGPRHLIAKPALSTPPAGASPSSARVPPPPIVSRGEWGADESKRTGTPGFAPIKRAIVHHTDTANDDPDPAATVRAVYAYHTGFRGWNDIGYNFLVDAQGRVYEGRWARSYAAGQVHDGEDGSARGVIGAHAEGINSGSVGVALLGEFGSSSPTQAAVNGLQAVLSWKADRHDIDVAGSSSPTKADGTVLTNLPNISGHRDTKSTSCPGDVLWGRLPNIRQQVQHIVMSAHGTTPGYWVATKDGGVLAFGGAGFFGSMGGRRLNAPIVGLASTVSGKGYWLLGADGGIFSFGDARFFGSTGSLRLNSPVIGMAPTPTGNGYWLVAGDGGIFSYGDARFFGSTGAMKLNAPVLGMAPTSSGGGYWLFARDGGIFSYGNAVFHGSTGSLRLNSPVNGMDADAAGRGYWLVARDGGIFAFDVPFWGSVPGLGMASYPGAAAMKATKTGQGYYVLASNGGIAAFGDARDFGSKAVAAGQAVGMALVPPNPS